MKPVQPTFSLCHATARVPFGWHDAYSKWIYEADAPQLCEYILVVDAPQGTSINTNEPVYTAKIPGTSKVVYQHTHNGCVAPWNKAAKESTGKVLIMVQDDWFPCPHWDTELLRVIPDVEGEYVVDPYVGAYPESRGLMSCGILTRKRYERFGYYHYPGYLSLYGDDEFTEVARRDGVVIPAKHLKMLHDHPIEGSRPFDKVYEQENACTAVELGAKLFAERKSKGFPND